MGRGGALGTNCHFSIVNVATQNQRVSRWGSAEKPRAPIHDRVIAEKIVEWSRLS